uniref:hypothetical protein n=1 Tax=Candidatus Ventrenecus sp. TaxID=3085654 RepID=UPI003FEFD626
MDEKEILLKLYQNVDMGIVGIDAIYNQIETKELKKKIKSQRKEYIILKRKLSKLCKHYKVTDKELRPFVKLNSELMVGMKTIFDKSDSKIAKLMMEGTNKGLIQLQELLNHYNKKDKKLVKILEETLELEHQNNNELKKFL